MARTVLQAQEVEAIFRGALAPGAWDSLSAKDRNRLRALWTKELRGYEPDQLQAFVRHAKRSPMLVADAALHLKMVPTDEVPRDRPGDVESFIRFCNVHQRLVCHGVDLKGIHLLTDLGTLRRHEVVLGISGMGKSTYMARLLCQLAVYGTPMVLIDQEKVLLEDVLTHIPEERRKDVLIIDPSDMERSWGINLVQFARSFVDEIDPDYASKVEYLNDRHSSEITAALAVLQLDTAGYSPGPHVREAINNILLAAVERENTSMIDGIALLTVPAIRELVAPSISRESVRNFLLYALKEYSQDKLDGVRNKLDPFQRRVMINMFSRRDACISIEQMLAENKIIVLDLDSTKLSKPISRLIGYIFLILLRITLEHRYSKAVDSGRLDALLPCYIMVDEFRNFSSTSTIDLFAEGRKRQASVIVGLQSLDQIGDDIANSLYNVSTWTVFNSGPEDAARVCRLFGFTNRLGNPRLEEITALPKHVAKLRYEASHDTEGVQRHNFHAVTLQAYPPLPVVPQGREILRAMRKHSRDTYYKPNNEEDTRTIYDANDQTNDHVLRAIWDANNAVLLPNDYWLDGREQLAREGAAGHFVSQNLIRAVLEARGMQLTKERLSQSIRYLKARRLVVTAALPTGYKTNRLTADGLRALEDLVTPATSSNEGGPDHRRAVRRAFIALSRLGALRMSVPTQKSADYTPDLVIESLPQKLLSILGLPSHPGPFHVQVEVATARHPDRMVSNILNALKQRAFPILILPDAAVQRPLLASLSTARRQAAGGILAEATRLFGRAWAGLVVGADNSLQLVPVDEGGEAQAGASAGSAERRLEEAVGEYLSGEASVNLDLLQEHLARKGFQAELAGLPALLEGTFGFLPDESGRVFTRP